MSTAQRYESVEEVGRARGPLRAIDWQIAAEVIVTAPVSDRRAMAERFGATTTLDPVTEPVAGLGVDAFIDCSGATPAVQTSTTAVRGAGAVVLAGMDANEIPLPIRVIQNGDMKVTGSSATPTRGPSAPTWPRPHRSTWTPW